MVHELDSGRNKRWSFSSVLRVMSEEERTGILEVSGADGEWEIHLRKGYVLNVVARDGSPWMTGELLDATGTVSAEQLERSSRRASSSGVRLDDVLVSEGLVSRDQLSRFQTLELRETLLPLFRKVGVTCRFRKEAPDALDGVQPIPLRYLLKEGERRAKEWPLLDKALASLDAIYAKNDGTVGEVLGSLHTGLREREMGQSAASLEENLAGGGEISGAERLVYFRVNGKKPVRQLAKVTGLGEYETVRAIYRLLQGEFIHLVADEGSEEVRQEPTVLPLLVRCAFYLLLGLFVAAMALRWTDDAPFDAAELLAVRAAPSELANSSQRARVESALEVYYRERNRYPAQLDELRMVRLLSDDDLSQEVCGGEIRYTVSAEGDQYALVVEVTAQE